MGDIRYFKAFKLDELFILDRTHSIKDAIKNLDLSETSSEMYNIPLISTSSKNNGIAKYISDNGLVPVKNKITMASNGVYAGVTFYHDYSFIPNNEAVVLKFINNILEILVEDIPNIGYFLSKLITKIFVGNKSYGWEYKPTARYGREIILLPVISCEATESIWEDIDEDGNITYLTLDVEYIKELMDTAKKRKEEKTIRFYEAQAAKYELEKAKYELEKAKYESNPDFVRKLKESHFKAFKLDELFILDRTHSIKDAIKNLDLSDTLSDVYNTPLISTSSKNNGIAKYISDGGLTPIKNKITMATNGVYAGVTFYHDYSFIPNNEAVVLKFINNILESLVEDTPNVGYFLSKLITKIFVGNKSYGWEYKPSARYGREIILLPVINCEATGEDDIQPDIMSYYYILGQERLYQNKINHYNQLIGG